LLRKSFPHFPIPAAAPPYQNFRTLRQKPKTALVLSFFQHPDRTIAKAAWTKTVWPFPPPWAAARGFGFFIEIWDPVTFFSKAAARESESPPDIFRFTSAASALDKSARI